MIVATIAGYLRRSQPKKSGTPIGAGLGGSLPLPVSPAPPVCLACAACGACGACALSLRRSRKPAAADTGPDRLAYGQRWASGCGQTPCELPGTPLALSRQRRRPLTGQWELVWAVRLQLARVLLSPAGAGEQGNCEQCSVHLAHGTCERVAAGVAVAGAASGCGSASAISERNRELGAAAFFIDPK